MATLTSMDVASGQGEGGAPPPFLTPTAQPRMSVAQGGAAGRAARTCATAARRRRRPSPSSDRSAWTSRGTLGGSLEPRLVPRRSRGVGGGLDEMIISRYAGGMTVRDIESHLARTVGVEVSRETNQQDHRDDLGGGQSLAAEAPGPVQLDRLRVRPFAHGLLVSGSTFRGLSGSSAVRCRGWSLGSCVR